ncbi:MULTISPECIES: HTTM domain-containing protein [unclassified Streptomyces]|uniref:HTTM domain-containing protein n=1 Tax=unclassified Streptomyces TaxID=2593676 RepID=UPI0022580FA6|nr:MULTISPECIES: HTTM domain-containing protein [unclassified Streptomyces]MCX4526894.1 HTTM domain-containing protein [Streptomyces sp. NBC_01551]MCX4542546.1 HTTM domain-containing protein [Streptomyces sp. NBC_01565]
MTRLRAAAGRGLAKATGQALGPYQSAVVRIGFSATWLFFLLREFPNRGELYGPDGPWSWELARRLTDSNEAFSVLMWSGSALWFECVYAVSVLASAALMLGWRTRTMSVVFMVGVLSLQNRSVFMGDGGDNVIHLMAIYLVLTRCGQVWSLDARARRGVARGSRGSRDVAGPVLWGVLGVVVGYGAVAGRLTAGWLVAFAAVWVVLGLWWTVERYEPEGEGRAVLDVLANLLHNAGMLVIMAEVCLIYATAGWYKIQGSRWQDGTALYYPLRLDYFTPWPALSGVLAGSGVLVMLLSYGTVAVQVAFPFTLFNRRIKNVLLAVMMLEHAGIAVLLGLPFFSMAMIAADAVFLPTGFLVWLGVMASGRGRGRGWGRRSVAVPGPADGEAVGVPVEVGPGGR